MNFNLFGIFVAGLLTFVTPCVLPMVPIYLTALVGGDLRRGAGGRGQLVVRAGFFAVGFVLVFTLMGLTASSVGRFIGDHKAVVQGGGALLILLFGLKFLGVIRIPWFDRIVRADDRRLHSRFGGVNALVMGVVFAAGWSPCVGPVLGSVLTYTASAAADPWVGAGYLATYGLGLALPLLVTAAFAEAGVRFLRRINPYLHRIEQVIGIVLVVVAASLLVDLAGQVRPAQGPESAPAAALTRGEDGQRWPVMVEFYAQDCPVCQRMKAVVAGITHQCDGEQVLVRTVDLTAPGNEALASRHHLVGLPTFVFLDRDGTEVARLIGEQSEQALKQALSALRGMPCPGVGRLPAPQPAEEQSDMCGLEELDAGTGSCGE